MEFLSGYPNFCTQFTTTKAHPKSCAKSLAIEYHRIQRNNCMYTDQFIYFFSLEKSSIFILLPSTFRCVINNKNIEPFQMLFLAGVFFMFIATVASYCLDKIPPKILICKCLPSILQSVEMSMKSNSFVRLCRQLVDPFNGLWYSSEFRDQFSCDCDFLCCLHMLHGLYIFIFVCVLDEHNYYGCTSVRRWLFVSIASK